MKHVRIIFLCSLTLSVVFLACGKSGQNDNSKEVKTDSQLIQEALQEAAERWHYGDKAALYDMEFEYFQDLDTYDDYLNEDEIKRLQADTLESLAVYAVQLFDHDSAHVRAKAVFVGPSGKKTRFDEGVPYLMYYHRGRWIHPTLSNIDEQLEWELNRHIADSIAAAEGD